MITLGEYVGGPIEFGFSQKEYDKITAIWKGGHHFERLDSITTSADELDRLVDVLREMKDASSDLVLHAGLPEFELVVTEPIPSMNISKAGGRWTVWQRRQLSRLLSKPQEKEVESARSSRLLAWMVCRIDWYFCQIAILGLWRSRHQGKSQDLYSFIDTCS